MEYHLYSSRPTYGAQPTFIASGLLFNTDYTGYASVYAVSKDTAEAIVETGTTQGFKGVVWSERLWLDFDSYEAADRAESKLKEMGYDFIAYDTGGRGAHFGVLRGAYPSHLLPAMDRQWVEEHFPEADKSIYTHLHPFRLPDTVHEKTGRKKRVVCEFRGSTLILSPFKKEELRITPTTRSEGRHKSLFNNFRVMREMRPLVNGERHYSLVRLVYALRDDAKVSKNEALYWCTQWNLLHTVPKEDCEIVKAISSIYD